MKTFEKIVSEHYNSHFRLIINDCLDSGTQFPFIEWGIKNKYGIVVANTNVNQATVNGKEVDIRVRWASLQSKSGL